MFVSIGVTTYNRKKLTEFCLKTINETVPKIERELIVVDNNSTDGTRDLLNDLFDKRQIDKITFNPENYHLGKAINQFYDSVHPDAEWLIYIDNDLFCMEGWYENFLRVVGHYGVKLDYAYCVMRKATFREKGVVALTNKGRHMSPPQNPEVGAGFAIRQSVLKKTGIRFVETPWHPGWGSNFSVLRLDLIKHNLWGVELAKPCILTQNCEFNNPDFEDYYKEVFGVRGRLDRFERLKKQGYAENEVDEIEYYEGSGYNYWKEREH